MGVHTYCPAVDISKNCLLTLYQFVYLGLLPLFVLRMKITRYFHNIFLCITWKNSLFIQIIESCWFKEYLIQTEWSAMKENCFAAYLLLLYLLLNKEQLSDLISSKKYTLGTFSGEAP